MLNFRKKKREEERKLVRYKNYPPAEVIDIEKRGRKFYLLLRWSNCHLVPKWVRADKCENYVYSNLKFKDSLGSAIPVPFTRGKARLNWFERIIVKLQNWWYGRKN